MWEWKVACIFSIVENILSIVEGGKEFGAKCRAELELRYYYYFIMMMIVIIIIIIVQYIRLRSLYLAVTVSVTLSCLISHSLAWDDYDLIARDHCRFVLGVRFYSESERVKPSRGLNDWTLDCGVVSSHLPWKRVDHTHRNPHNE